MPLLPVPELAAWATARIVVPPRCRHRFPIDVSAFPPFDPRVSRVRCPVGWNPRQMWRSPGWQWLDLPLATRLVSNQPET